jgi:hypothetical protein
MIEQVGPDVHVPLKEAAAGDKAIYKEICDNFFSPAAHGAHVGDVFNRQRIENLEAEVERLKKTEQFLRSERPMARRLTQYENALASIAANTCCDTCQEAALVAQAALKKEKP